MCIRDRLDWVDRAGGLVRVDAGVTIGQLIDRFTPQGWFVPVTPGTRQVTVGGAIAADIHGKNHHHDGSFGDHVISMRVRLANDEKIVLSPSQHPDLFWATVGGMGLTGIVLDAVIRLVPIPTTTVAVETQRFSSLSDLVAEMERTDTSHAFSVAWVDLLGGARSVLTQGSFASTDQLAELAPVPDAAGAFRRPPTMAVGLPRFRLPRVATTPSIKLFNELWWRKAPAELITTGESITAFFHPLDAITDWNRVYGSRGFVQWQCVVPENQAMYEIVERFAALPAYFSVLKRLGPTNAGLLSFPDSGWTLAVDLPATSKVLVALDELDQLVVDANGRNYLAKDATLTRASFERMYPRLPEFRTIRNQVDPTHRFASDLSERLGL